MSVRDTDRLAADAGESNFQFLAQKEPLLFRLASSAEHVFRFDPNATLIKLRQLGEAMAQAIALRVGIRFDKHTAQSELI